MPWRLRFDGRNIVDWRIIWLDLLKRIHAADVRRLFLPNGGNIGIADAGAGQSDRLGDAALTVDRHAGTLDASGDADRLLADIEPHAGCDFKRFPKSESHILTPFIEVSNLDTMNLLFLQDIDFPSCQNPTYGVLLEIQTNVRF